MSRFPFHLKLLIVIVLIIGALWVVFYAEYEERPVIVAEGSALIYGDLRIPVEIVDSPAERVRGLSGRTSLDETSGLLFIFEEPGEHGIWMKDMNFPIDIIWLDENFEVINIKRDATPDSFPTVFKPTRNASYVLEVNAGFAEKNAIKIGNRFHFEE